MFLLALRTLRRRKGGFVASLIVLFIGALTVMACGGLMETGIRLTTSPRRFAAAPLVITGTQAYTERVRLSSEVVSRAGHVDGVARVIPDISFVAALLKNGQPLNDAMQLSGHAWSSAQLAPYYLVSGSAPVSSMEVVLDQRLALRAGKSVGMTVDVVANGQPQHARISGIANDPAGTAPVIFFSDTEAQKLFGHAGQVDDIGVIPSAGASLDEVRSRISQTIQDSNAEVLSGDERGRAEFPGITQDGDTLIAIAAVFGGITIMVAIFIVSSTLSLSVQQRRREMALLQAIGAAPRQIQRMVVSETLFIAVIATSLALIPSDRFGAWLLNQFSLSGAVSSALVYRQGWIPDCTGILIALLAALVAALVAARAATHTRPTDALAEATIQRRWLSGWRLAFSLICLASGVALALVTALVIHGPVASSTAGPTAMLWAVGLALLGPGIAGLMISLLQWPLRWLGGLTGRLASRNLRINAIRVAGAVTPVMLATGLATGLLFVQTSLSDQSAHVYASVIRADAILTSSTGGLPLSTVQAASRQFGVGGVSALASSSGYINTPNADPQDQQNSEPFIGITSTGLATTNFTVTDGNFGNLNGYTIALPDQQAVSLEKKIGDMVTVRFGDGMIKQLRLVARFSIPSGYESAVLPADLLLQHVTTPLVPQVLIRAKSSVGSMQLAQTLRNFAEANPSMQVAMSGSANGPVLEQTGAWVNYLLVGMIVGYTVIALVNTVIVATIERRREFALQRLIGATRGQVLRMISAEALLTSIAGVLLGSFVGAVTLVPFCIGLRGSPWPSGPFWLYEVIVSVAVALTLLTTFVVSVVVLHARPVEVVGARE